MDSGRLDRKIKDRLLDHEEFIDKDELWAGIAQKQEKKRLPFWRLGLGLFSLTAVLLLAIIFWPESNKPVVSDNTKIDVVNPVAKTILKSNPKLTKIESDRIIEDSKPLVTNKLNKEKESIVIAQIATLKESKSATALISNQPITSLVEVGDVNTTSQTDTPNTDGTITQPSVYRNTMRTKPTLGIINEPLFSKAQVFKEKSTAQSSPNVLLEEKLSSAISDKAVILSLIDKLEIEAHLHDLDQRVLPSLTYHKASMTLKNKEDKLQFGLNIYTSYGFIKSSRSTASMDHQALVDLQNEKERPLEDLGIGLSLDLLFNEDYYFSIGIEKHRLQEYLDYSELQTGPSTVDDAVVRKTYFQDGSTSSVTGTVSGIERTTTSYKVYNTFNRLDLPLSIGYRYGWKKLDVLSLLSLVYNINNSFNGYKINTMGLVLQDPDIYKKRLGLSYGIALRMAYKLNDSQQIWLEPKYSFGQKSVANTSNPIDQRYQFWYTSLAYRYQF